MQLFSSITSSNEFEVGTIAGGIYTKLITSITGLVIGLGAYLAYSYLNTQIDKTPIKWKPPLLISWIFCKNLPVKLYE